MGPVDGADLAGAADTRAGRAGHCVLRDPERVVRYTSIPRHGPTEVLARINDHNIQKLDQLLPWHWATEMERRKVAA
jgi:hypothetical protein